MRVIEVRGGFGNSEKSMHIVGRGKQRTRNFPRLRTVLRNEADDACLSLANRAQVAIKKFFIVTDWFTVAPINQGGGESSHPRKTDQILRQRSKASGWIDRIRREDRIRRDSFKHAIAGNYRPV